MVLRNGRACTAPKKRVISSSAGLRVKPFSSFTAEKRSASLSLISGRLRSMLSRWPPSLSTRNVTPECARVRLAFDWTRFTVPAAAPRPKRLEFGPREISTESMLYGSIGIRGLLEKFPIAMLTPLPLIGLPTPRMRLAVGGIAGHAVDHAAVAVGRELRVVARALGVRLVEEDVVEIEHGGVLHLLLRDDGDRGAEVLELRVEARARKRVERLVAAVGVGRDLEGRELDDFVAGAGGLGGAAGFCCACTDAIRLNASPRRGMKTQGFVCIVQVPVKSGLP